MSIAHFSLYRSFLSSIGANAGVDEEFRRDEFIDVQARLAENDPILGVAAFCYASEYLCLFEFEPIAKAVEFYFPHADVRYLDEIQVDVRHTAEVERALDLLLVASHGSSEEASVQEDGTRIETALRSTLKVRRGVYDRVMSKV